jgi:LacI family transcriptional regulator
MRPLRIHFMSSMSSGYDLRIFRGISGFVRAQRPAWDFRWSKDFESMNFEGLDGIVGFALGADSLEKIRRLEIPAVLTSRRMLGRGYPCVLADDIAIGRMAATFARGTPHSFLAFIGSADLPFSDDRHAGFTAGEEPCLRLQLGSVPGAGPSKNRLLDFLPALPKGTLLFAANDNLARNVAMAAQELALAIPEDLSLIGVDADEVYSIESPVSLTSVDPNPFAIGFRAAELLHGWLQSGESPPADLCQWIPPAGILEAASTRCAPPADRRMVEAARHLESHLRDPLNVADLARRSACSRRSLEQRFHRTFGVGPGEYFRRARMEQARLLLREGNMLVYEVAEHCGFGSQHYFSSAFRRENGVSPSQYRNAHRGEPASSGLTARNARRNEPGD